jgi:hypothetical protein
VLLNCEAGFFAGVPMLHGWSVWVALKVWEGLHVHLEFQDVKFVQDAILFKRKTELAFVKFPFLSSGVAGSVEKELRLEATPIEDREFSSWWWRKAFDTG